MDALLRAPLNAMSVVDAIGTQAGLLHAHVVDAHLDRQPAGYEVPLWLLSTGRRKLCPIRSRGEPRPKGHRPAGEASASPARWPSVVTATPAATIIAMPDATSASLSPPRKAP